MQPTISPLVPAAASAFDTPSAPSTAPLLHQLLDDRQEWSAFGRPCRSEQEGGAWESHILLEGMHCAACALTIEDALRAVPGVLQAEVSAATQRARIVWEPEQVLPSGWMAAVRQAGYGAMPAMDALAREQRQRENRRALWRWLLAGFCMMQVMMYAWPAYVALPGDLTLEMERLLRWASWVISLPVMLFACGPFFSSAWRDVIQRRVSMDLPVALGIGITFLVSTVGTFDPTGPFGREVFFDSLTMFVFFLLTGRWLELRLRDRTAGALEAVMNRLPDSIERRQPDGTFERVAVRRLTSGDTVRVLPGEAFPADGRISQGQTLVDEALLTGESTPLERTEGSAVTAGSYNLQAAVEVLVESTGTATRFGQIVALMESAALQKPRLAQLADKVARPFLLLVLLAAVMAAIWWWPRDPSHALMVAVAVLIVTCPCALSLATPVAMLTAAGTLARHGVLTRNLQGLEALAQVNTVVFDKTGTLTRDGMVVAAIHASELLSEKDALALAAALGQHSLHPVSRALVSAAQAQDIAFDNLSRWRCSQVQERVGHGLSAWLEDAQGVYPSGWVRLGSVRHTGAASSNDVTNQRVFLVHTVAEDAAPVEWACFDLHEDIRSHAAAAVTALTQAGLQVQLLSGDRGVSVSQVAALAGIVRWYGDCTPQDKLAALQTLQSQGQCVAMVGDGLNDGPVLAGAHVAFAFGRSVALAQSKADFVILGGSLELIPQTIALAQRTMRVVRQNLWWAAGYNALSVPLAVAGYMPAWLAGLGMALSSLLVVMNAARLSRPLPPLTAPKNAPMANSGSTTALAA